MTLPNFIIIGAKKAGTTSLYNYCDQHPDVYMSPLKEARFFMYDETNPEHRRKPNQVFPIRTTDQYQALFADARGQKIRGEASPGYLVSRVAPDKMHALIPNVKLAVSLRNPADRAYSNYLMRVRSGQEIWCLDNIVNEQAHWLQTSFYYENIKRYFDLFSHEQIHVILYDDLRRDGVYVARDLYKFLGVDEQFLPDVSFHYNVSGIPKTKLLHRIYSRLYQNHPRFKIIVKKFLPQKVRRTVTKIRQSNLKKPPSLPPALRNELVRYYKEDVLRLQELIQRDLSGWLQTS